MLSYAGVDLSHPFPSGLLEWTDFRIPGAWIHDFPRRLTPFGPWPRIEPITPLKWVWPTGASRHAYVYLVVHQTQLAPIRRAVMPGGERRAGPLVYSFEDTTALASMFALPARPLQQVGASGWYLLPLVDARFFWWEVAADISVTGGTTTWAGLFEEIAEALGIALTVDSVPSAYLSPATGLTSAYGSLPLLLDACCMAVGSRLVRQFDGSCRVWRPENSLSAQRDMVRTMEADRLAGGTYSLTAP